MHLGPSRALGERLRQPLPPAHVTLSHTRFCCLRRFLRGHDTMTLLSTFRILPVQQGDTVAPSQLDLADLSIVVPVKNNQAGVERLLTACLKVFPPNHCPAEIVLVDNLSSPPLDVPAQVASALPVRLVVCSQPGAAAARNVGARLARTQWILFLDSDCIPTVGLIEGYQHAMSGAIGYVGGVQASHTNTLSAYYDTQGILRPLPAL